VLFLIEVGTRRVRILGVTRNPDGRWVAQQARNLAIEAGLDNVGFLIRDRDAKFTSAFDEVFTTEGARVILTPIRAPKANAFAERFVRTVRNELLDLTLVTGRRHLVRLLAEYEAHYNSHRPHRGLALETPAERDAERSPITIDMIRPRPVVGGLINESRAGGIALFESFRPLQALSRAGAEDPGKSPVGHRPCVDLISTRTVAALGRWCSRSQLRLFFTSLIPPLPVILGSGAANPGNTTAS
jgi:hypothetical protein